MLCVKKKKLSITQKKKKSGAKKRGGGEMKTKPMHHFQVGYIHSAVKLFWVLRLITCFNVGNNFTTTNAYNILSEFPCSLTKVSHGFNTIKNIYSSKSKSNSLNS